MRYRRAIGLALLLASSVTVRAEETGIDLARIDRRVTAEDRRHWAFQPVKRPQPPTVRDRSWPRNPIDAFVLEPLEREGWKPAADVEPRVWLRRVYLDVLGLPPSLAEQERFLAAVERSGETAHDALVDELLGRPEYGERWGRHWLDAVRFAETSGYERDAIKPSAWRYRDWVLRSLNDDKPYDRFVLEQLAGDELPEAGADSLLGLGFTRLGPWDDEPADPQEDRFDQLDDVVNATSLVFMGLTMGCARCHHHKFEALTTHDYYRLVAIFNPLVRPRRGRAELDLPVGTRVERDREAERDRQIAGLTKDVPPKQPLPKEIREQITELKHATPDLPRGYFLHEPSPMPPDTHLLVRGKATRPGPRVEPGVPTVLAAEQPAFLPPDERTSRRRLTLARWLVDPKHPLTARVMANRIWLHHFGEGIVRTPNDFGIAGQAPTHPELLDWLAATFVEGGWSMKRLHRLILTSRAYRMSKKANSDYLAADPENRLLWRSPLRRLEVEAIRDSMLAVSGRLNPQKYGPSMYPEVPAAALAGNSDPDKIWKPFDERDASRRSVYAFIKRSFVVPMFEVLDLCDTTRPSDRRQTTTVAPQALTLFNGEFVNRQARALADRLRREAPGGEIEHAYRLAFCRRPTVRERKWLTTFLRESTLEELCRVLFNSNEFVYTD